MALGDPWSLPRKILTVRLDRWVTRARLKVAAVDRKRQIPINTWVSAFGSGLVLVAPGWSSSTKPAQFSELVRTNSVSLRQGGLPDDEVTSSFRVY